MSGDSEPSAVTPLVGESEWRRAMHGVTADGRGAPAVLRHLVDTAATHPAATEEGRLRWVCLRLHEHIGRLMNDRKEAAKAQPIRWLIPHRTP